MCFYSVGRICFPAFWGSGWIFCCLFTFVGGKFLQRLAGGFLASIQLLTRTSCCCCSCWTEVEGQTQSPEHESTRCESGKGSVDFSRDVGLVDKSESMWTAAGDDGSPQLGSGLELLDVLWRSNGLNIGPDYFYHTDVLDFNKYKALEIRNYLISDQWLSVSLGFKYDVFVTEDSLNPEDQNQRRTWQPKQALTGNFNLDLKQN